MKSIINEFLVFIKLKKKIKVIDNFDFKSCDICMNGLNIGGDGKYHFEIICWN